MENILKEERFSILSPDNKAFIIAFDSEIKKLGYDFGNAISSGYCWGQYMVIYAKTGVKSKQVAARIYIHEKSIVLRLFLNKIDKHREYIEASKPFIKDVFTGTHADCHHCHNDKDGSCKFRKSYTLDNKLYDKCNGVTFEFWEPDMIKLPDYINLLKEFYPSRVKAAKS